MEDTFKVKNQGVSSMFHGTPGHVQYVYWQSGLYSRVNRILRTSLDLSTEVLKLERSVDREKDHSIARKK